MSFELFVIDVEHVRKLSCISARICNTLENHFLGIDFVICCIGFEVDLKEMNIRHDNALVEKAMAQMWCVFKELLR